MRESTCLSNNQDYSLPLLLPPLPSASKHRADKKFNAASKISNERLNGLSKISPATLFALNPGCAFAPRPTGLPYRGKRSFRRANQRAGICARLVSESIELSLRTVIA